MKKVLLLLAGAAIAHTGFSQISVDPEVGLNVSNIRTKVGDNDANTTDSKVGFSAGVGVNFDIAKGLYVKPGIYYHMLGGQTEALGVTGSSTIHYLRIPVNLGYRYTIAPKAGLLFAEAGPYVGFALAGQSKLESSLGDVTTDIEFGDGVAENKAFDWGFNFNLGYETPWNVYVKAGYGLGLGTMSNVDDVSETNRHWNFAVGYRIKF